MKKEKRLIKIDDNFSSIECYLDDAESPVPGDLSVLVIVASRTFSGRYTCRFNRDAAAVFGASSLPWLEALTSETGNPGVAPLTFAARDDALKLEVQSISSTKVLWMVTCRPFLPDIEVLQLKLETEANLVRNIAAWTDTADLS